MHGAVHGAVRDDGNPAAELRHVVEALREEGVTALDATNPGERAEAVAATIEVSLRRLTTEEQTPDGLAALAGPSTAHRCTAAPFAPQRSTSPRAPA